MRVEVHFAEYVYIVDWRTLSKIETEHLAFLNKIMVKTILFYSQFKQKKAEKIQGQMVFENIPQTHWGYLGIVAELEHCVGSTPSTIHSADKFPGSSLLVSICTEHPSL